MNNKKLADQDYNNSIDDLTDSKPVFQKRSNESLTEEDYKEVQNAARVKPVQQNRSSATSIKQQQLKENQRVLRTAQAEIDYNANPNTPLFRKTEAELREERLAELDRENNARMTEQVLAGLEKASQNQNNIQQPYSQGYTQQQSIPINNKKRSSPQHPNNELVTAQDVNTIGRPPLNGFYTQSTHLNQQSNNEFAFIPAVVHGNGDGIVVTNGSSIRLRLLSETILNVQGMQRILPRNTLINGRVSISGERVQIYISSVRIDNNIIPVQLVVYDIDGSQGLYIPNLMDKNLLARELAEAGARPMQGGIWSQGSMSTQIGTNMATDVARSLMQGASQYARRKMNNVKVTIKPNYKVLLTKGSFSNTTETESISEF